MPPGRGFGRWLLPSLADGLGLFLLGALVLIGRTRLFGDSDPALHVATGNWILAHGAVPRVDPFSATHAGQPWFAFEWLATLLLALAYRWLGWAGLLVLSAAILVAAHLLLYRYLVRSGRGAVASLLAVLAAAVTGSAHWLARPHLFTVLFLVLWLVVLEEVTRGRRRPAWLFALPGLALLWANLHGGFLIGPILLGCYGLAEVIASRPGTRGPLGPRAAAARRRIGPLAAAFGAVALAVTINPWGFRLPVHLIAFSSVPRAELVAIEEWSPASLGDRAGLTLWAFLFLCLVAAAVVIRSSLARQPGREPSAPRAAFHLGTLLAFGVGAVLALGAIRHVAVVAVFGAVVLADGLSILAERRVPPAEAAVWERLRRYESTHGGSLVAAGLLAILLLAWASRLPAGYDPDRFPVELVRELREERVVPRGPVLAPAHWGGYLILEWPGAKVYADGRWDMYGDAFTRRYLSVYEVEPGWPERLAEDGVDWALLPPDGRLARAMRADAGWEVSREGHAAALFRRRE